MRAERDEYDYRTSPKRKERRIAYEIAIGVIIAHIILWPLERLASYAEAQWQLGKIRIQIDAWEKNGRKGDPFNNQ